MEALDNFSKGNVTDDNDVNIALCGLIAPGDRAIDEGHSNLLQRVEGFAEEIYQTHGLED